MKLRLKPPPNLPLGIREYYDLSGVDTAFEGMMLGKRGVVARDQQITLQMCASCKTSLMDKKRINPPKFAIANGLYMASLPETLLDSTFTENAMLNLAQPMHFISVVRGGKHASLRSHAYFFRANPAPPAQILPRDVVSEGVIGVTIVGAMTSAQKAATLKKYDVRLSRLRQQLRWYKEHNHLYKYVEEQEDWETSLSTIATRVVVDQAHEIPQLQWRSHTPDL
ncbi:Neutral zinc metallopeptidase [Phytophthora nicotianae]|uniref:Neutral zinc metallopeptidase n=1 Tax=Phytophthora nicotianae TaxID=4792 RepID=A0A0W8CCQ0_PHYNI|nr:Neutral zinc metallopeptidase [Phytophthora nicotianae]